MTEPRIYTEADWRVLDSLKLRNLTALEGITEQVNAQIIRELSDGINARESIPKLTKRLQDSVAMGKQRATTMARTETINACVDGARVRYEQYGVKEFQYIAASDSRTCKQCAELDGKVFKLTDNAHMPPLHPNCRCCIAAVIPSRKKTEKPKISELKTQHPVEEKSPISLASAKTVAEMEMVIKTMWNKDLIIDQNFKNLHTETIRNTLAEMDKVLRDFPGIGLELKMLTSETRRNTYGFFTPSLNRINFCNNFYGKDNNKKFIKSFAEDIRMGYHPDTPISFVGVHELGHAIDFAVAKKSGKSWSQHTNELLLKAGTAVLGKEPTPAELAKLRMELSIYAHEKEVEVASESFADYYANGTKAHPLAREVVRILKEEWNK